MFRKALLCLSLIGLVGCNDDDKTETTPTTPEYQLPKILVIDTAALALYVLNILWLHIKKRLMMVLTLLNLIWFQQKTVYWLLVMKTKLVVLPISVLLPNLQTVKPQKY